MENGNAKKLVRVGSRKSALALTQTKMIMDLISSNNSDIEFQLVTMDTMGDKLMQNPLSNIKDSTLFTKELELALAANEVDFVVHSLKDVPVRLSQHFVIGSVSLRESCEDAVVMKVNSKYQKLEDLPKDSVIGTSSIRRIAQIKKKYPHLKFATIRGNLNTRLLKLDDPNQAKELGRGDGTIYEAIILAKAGLERLNWKSRISEILSYEDTMYAAGQGALGCECRVDDIETRTLLASINDEHSMLTCIVERCFLSKLEGGCSIPISVRTKLKNEELIFEASIMDPEGNEVYKHKMEIQLPGNSEIIDLPFSNGDHSVSPSSNTDDSDKIAGIQIYDLSYETKAKITASSLLGFMMADILLKQGGSKILNALKSNSVKDPKIQN